MQKNDILNIPEIQKIIGTKHKKFIKDFGPASEKVMADHKLFADLVMAKLHRLALVFREEKVIDDVKMTEDGPYRKVYMSKYGNSTYVDVSTNGLVIVLEGHTYTTGLDIDFKWPKEKFFHVNSAEFDWNKFSVALLEYIHVTIYERREAIEERLKGMFNIDSLKDVFKKSK